MKRKYKKMKFVVLGRLRRLFSDYEATNELFEFVTTHFKKTSSDQVDFQELNGIFLAKLADKRTLITKAYEYHARMLELASLKGQKQAISCLVKLTKEYAELYGVYRRFVKQFPALRCPLACLTSIDKSQYDHESYIAEANEFFASVLN